MNAEGLMSAGGLSKKIVSFLILVCIDIFLSCYIVFIDLSENLSSDKNVNAPFDTSADKGFASAISALQLVLHFCLIFWYFFLIWKTFMFRYTLMGKLRETFYWAINIAVLNGIFFLGATGLRIVSILLCMTSCLST